MSSVLAFALHQHAHLEPVNAIEVRRVLKQILPAMQLRWQKQMRLSSVMLLPAGAWSGTHSSFDSFCRGLLK